MRIGKYLPVLGLIVFYAALMQLRQAGYIKNYWLQIIMFALINGMVSYDRLKLGIEGNDY